MALRFAAARGETQGDWQTVGSSRTSKPVEEIAEEMEHVPLSPESEVGAEMGPPQDRRGRGQEEEEGSTLPPLQDKRRSGNVSDGKEEEDAMGI
jgi:hypothetical protein